MEPSFGTKFWGEWRSGLRYCNENRKFPNSNPIRRSTGLRDPTLLRGDLRVKIVRNAVINFGLVRLPPREWPKGGYGTTKGLSVLFYYIYGWLRKSIRSLKKKQTCSK